MLVAHSAAAGAPTTRALHPGAASGGDSSTAHRGSSAPAAARCRRRSIAAVVVVGGAGALGGDHAGADRGLRRAGGAEDPALPGLEHALEHFAALAGLGVGDPHTGHREALLGIQVGEAPHPQRAMGDEAEPAPLEERPELHRLRDRRERRELPSGGTTRRTGSPPARPASSCRASSRCDCRMSSGSKPATTTACRSARAMNSNGREPMMVLTWPGPMKPSSRISGESRIALIAGMIVTWLQKTEKLRHALVAAPAAASPRWRAPSSRSRSRRTRPRAPGSRARAAARRAANRRSARRRRGLGVEQAPRALPGTRIMSPKVVKITSGWRAIAIASSMRPIGITHTGQPGPCTSSTPSGSSPRAVLVDRVRVSAAHLHDLERPPRASAAISSPSAAATAGSGTRPRSVMRPRPSPPARARGAVPDRCLPLLDPGHVLAGATKQKSACPAGRASAVVAARPR